MRMKSINRWRGWIILILVFFSLGFVSKTAGDYFEISKNMEIFSRIYKEINEVYVDETNPTELMRTSINAMLENLDPYTNFYSESQIDYSKLMGSGQYSGIGAEVGLRGDKIIVLELFENGPADEAGIKVGDEIRKIDNESITGEGRTIDEVNSLLLGEKGSPVILTISRQADDRDVEEVISISRGGTEVQKENVPYFGMANESVGYILLSGFTQDAGKEVADATDKLKRENPDLKGIILDLRGNPGGRLDEAVNVVNVFVPQNEAIVEMKGRTPDSQNSFRTRLPAIDTEIPLAVIVNGRSASASEIVSGAIQDLDRGVIIGTRSFGKGLVQNVRPLSFNTQMKITIAKYYIPSGRCIQAIDYSHRNEDGSVGRIPDSLVTEFKTRNGRVVFDGAGVLPDVIVEKSGLQPVSKALRDQRLIFDFSTQFASHNEQISPPGEFKITDKIYDEFVSFVKDKGFTFNTGTEEELQTLENVMKKASYYEAVEDDFRKMEANLNKQKEIDLITHKEEIAYLLKKELINRYYYKQGVLESGFVDDPDILAAIDVLNDTVRYSKILGGGQ